jgi:hypothetical protein
MKRIPLLLAFLALILAFYAYKKRNEWIELFPPSLPDVEINKTISAYHSFDFPDKIWLHRVNSTQRAVLMQKKYKCFEIDMVFDSTKNCFDVHHPPAPSQNLCLEQLIGSLNNPNDRFYWLDFKNLDKSTKDSSLKYLLFICQKFKIQANHFVVESENPELLNSFTESGFITSYYIPHFNPYYSSENQIINYRNTVSNHLSKSKVNALSGYYYQLPFLEKYFSNYNYLVWHSDEKLNFAQKILYKRMLKNVKVKVILVRGISIKAKSGSIEPLLR